LTKKLETHKTCTFKNNCDVNSNCLFYEELNSYKCSCKEGFVGNGYKCYGNHSYLFYLFITISSYKISLLNSMFELFFNWKMKICTV
jgi:hypothetical protein